MEELIQRLREAIHREHVADCRNRRDDGYCDVCVAYDNGCYLAAALELAGEGCAFETDFTALALSEALGPENYEVILEEQQRMLL